MMARRAGLTVAHLEAGLRSGSYVQPFPEEIIRVLTMRLAAILFAPGQEAVANMRRMRVKGRIVDTRANTVQEALRAALETPGAVGGGAVIATMHRVENLKPRRRATRFIELLEGVATDHRVLFVAHGPTLDTIQRGGWGDRLSAAGIEVTSLMPHDAFAAALASAPFVITDGGSIQEECALLGTPTLLWRDRTERPDGLNANVVLSRYDLALIETFLADPERFRVDPQPLTESPSELILDTLLDALESVSPQ
jgi:UDP-N-acetylglucosamine 2-epimerase (non-hydrolysing)